MKTLKKEWINFLCLIVTIGINTLGAFGFINGLTQKEVSDMYVTLITPSPLTFSIWSVIYTSLIISFILMIIKKDDNYYKNATDKISTLFIASCILNIAWIVSFSFVQLELSVLFIFGLVITLALICKKITEFNNGKHWLLALAFGLYSGWLFIATVVNTAACLVKLEWNGFGISVEIWAIIVLIVAVILVFLVLTKLRNASFPLPIAWAFIGINQFLVSANGFNGQYILLQYIAIIGSSILIVFTAFQFYKNKMAITPKQ